MLEKFKELYDYRELLLSQILREIKIRYKQTIFGMLWAILQPLALMFVFSIIFSKFAQIPSEGIPYPIFSYCALLPWTFFASSLSFAIPSLVNNSILVTKVYFPKEILPISSVIVSFFDFCIACVIFFIMMFFYNTGFSLIIIFILPVLLIQILFTLSISLIASAINIYYRDVRYALPLVIQIWMYACPIIYPVSIVPEKFKTIYMLNPMAPIIDAYRTVLLKKTLPDFYYLSIAAIVSVVLFFVSYGYFKKLEVSFADII